MGQAHTAQKKNKKTAMQKAGIRVKRHDNQYLRTLVDPERYSGVRYPEKIRLKTGLLHLISNEEQYYFPADSSGTPSCEPAGTFLSVVTPTLVNPVLSYATETLDGTQYLTSIATEQTDKTGIFPLSPLAESPSTSDGQMAVVRNGPFVNLRGSHFWSDQEFALPGLEFPLPDGSVAYGFPFMDQIGSAGSYTIQFNIVFSQALIATDQCELVAINSAGATVTTGAVAPGAAATRWTVTLNIYSLCDLLANGQVGAGLTNLIGFRFRWTETSSPAYRQVWPIQSFYAVYRFNGAARTSYTAARFVPQEYPDQDVYQASVDRYRCVSMSAWMAYEGSALQDGGQIAATYYGGGKSPFENQLYNYDNIAEVPGSYQGPLKLGMYGWWSPAGDKDMLFRELNPKDRWDFPYIVIAGLVSTPTQVNSLRLRVVANVEIVSRAQYYSYGYGDTREELVEHAFAALKDFPHVMENPNHLAEIKHVITRAAEKAAGVGEWVVQNSSWLVPAVGAAAALL